MPKNKKRSWEATNKRKPRAGEYSAKRKYTAAEREARAVDRYEDEYIEDNSGSWTAAAVLGVILIVGFFLA